MLPPHKAWHYYIFVINLYVFKMPLKKLAKYTMIYNLFLMKTNAITILQMLYNFFVMQFTKIKMKLKKYRLATLAHYKKLDL